MTLNMNLRVGNRIQYGWNWNSIHFVSLDYEIIMIGGWNPMVCDFIEQNHNCHDLCNDNLDICCAPQEEQGYQ